MKKVLAALLAVVLAAGVTGCSVLNRENSSNESNSLDGASSSSVSDVISSSDKESSSSSKSAPTGGTFSSEIPQELEQQYKSIAEKLRQALENTYSVVGDTYDSYVANKQAVNDWYALVKSEADKLYYDTLTKSIEYYKALAVSDDREDYETVDKALDDLYDAVDGRCMDYFYDEVYKKLFDDLYDKYYKDVLDNSDVTDDYSAWLDEYSGFYSNWLDAYSGFYSDWLDCNSDFYSDWLNVDVGFLSKNFDVDSLIENTPSVPDENNPPKQSSISEEISSQPEESSNSEESSSDGILGDIIRPEVKEAIDSYEEFIDEYCDFMKKYAASDNPMTLMSEYMDYLQKLTEMGEKFDNMDESDWTAAETAYYTEVLLRCQKKLLEAANAM